MVRRLHRCGAGIVMVCVLLVGTGCGSPGTSTAGTPTTPAATTTATPAATTTAVGTGPLSASELVWLEGISTLHQRVDRVLGDSPTALTPGTLRTLAKQLRDGCSVELTRLGLPTKRLQPVYDLAKQGCQKYDEAATCFDTAAAIGIPVAGSPAEAAHKQAIDCGFAKPGDGSLLLAQAEAKGFEIKDAAR